MKNSKAYRRPEWKEFAKKIKARDDYKCLKCGRIEGEVTLQVHHAKYEPFMLPWECPESYCQTLCMGCHAKIHGKIMPTSGWRFVSVDDLGEDNRGRCERKTKTGVCGTSIRYEHTIFLPHWGYMVVGSECVEFLTEEDKYKSQQTVKALKDITKGLNKCKDNWSEIKEEGEKDYLLCDYKKHLVRIYQWPDLNAFSFYIIKSIYEDFIDEEPGYSFFNISLEKVKELAIMAIIGKSIRNEVKIEILRELYKKMKRTG